MDERYTEESLPVVLEKTIMAEFKIGQSDAHLERERQKFMEGNRTLYKAMTELMAPEVAKNAMETCRREGITNIEEILEIIFRTSFETCYRLMRKQAIGYRAKEN